MCIGMLPKSRTMTVSTSFSASPHPRLPPWYCPTTSLQGIYPLHEVYIRKVKVLKKPKFDISRLLEVHGEVATGGTSTGTVARTGEFAEPAVLEEV